MNSAVVNPRPTEAELNQRQDHNDAEKRNSYGRGVTHVEELEGIFVDINHQTTASVARTAFGENHDRVEHLERADHVDNHVEEDGWTDQRHGDVAEELEAVCAV